jgi:hypothetical protein
LSLCSKSRQIYLYITQTILNGIYCIFQRRVEKAFYYSCQFFITKLRYSYSYQSALSNYQTNHTKFMLVINPTYLPRIDKKFLWRTSQKIVIIYSSPSRYRSRLFKDSTLRKNLAAIDDGNRYMLSNASGRKYRYSQHVVIAS